MVTNDRWMTNFTGRGVCVLSALVGVAVLASFATAANAASPVLIDKGGYLFGVACPSKSQCTAVDARRP